MGNQVNVALKFTADTGQAKTSIQELQSLLNKLALEGASTNSNLLEAKKIQAAAEAAKELSYHLNNAYNAKTGRFDLSSLDKSLKTSNTNITELSTKFLDAGDTGQQAFLKLAQSISQADQPMLKVSNKLQDFAKTLKQTAKYQISNNILRGFQGAIQSAYGYAKDLNASLTDIRIVTGQSTEQMAKFAEQANKAAKALSTTTTDYTKGSLIYFQQGLKDDEVRERTEATIKMSNVTGESTSKIADQLTAVWNNFADGSKELSYYADAMVALGAATASSSDEISEGINKFAATAKTVGLSYEYATAALATVTARTRESADVVGNAFKTLFARIQGLNQGDTLDDGTTLNKYSSALDKVGINIKTTSGELKDMDVILDELGPKWKTLADDQKMALAQTVAGVRQYSQFMALMNNYDYFKENVSVAEQSTGALDKQAEIYAESWEAAQKRVRAAAEGVYQSLIDDKFFISFTNGIADIISGLDAFIDKAGGLKTVIMGVSSFLIANFSSKIPDAIKTLQYNFSLLTGGSQKAYKSILDQMNQASQKQFDLYKTSKGTQGISEDSSAGLAIKQANQLAVAKSKYYNIEDKLSNVEKQSYQIQLQQIEANYKDLEQQAKKNEEIQKTLQLQQQALTNKRVDVDKKTINNGLNLAEKAYSDLSSRKNGPESQNNPYQQASNDAEIFINKLDEYRRKIGEKYTAIHQEIMQSFSNGEFNLEASPIKLFKNLDFSKQTSEIERMVNAMKRISESGIDGADKIEVFKKQLKALSSVIDPAVQEATGLDKVFRDLGKIDNPDKLKGAIQVLEASLKQATIPAEKFEEVIRSWDGKSIDDLITKLKELGVNAEELKVKTEAARQSTDSFNPEPVIRMSQAFADLAGGVMSLYNIINSFKSIVDAMNNEDLSGWEKFGSIASGLTFMTMSLGSLGKQASTVGKVIPGLIAKFHGTTAAAAGAAGATGAAATGMAATGTAATGAAVGVGALVTGLLTIAGVALAVFLLFKGISKAIEDAYNKSPEGKLENITKATEEAKTAAEEAAQEYENLKTAFDEYDAAADKVDNLKVGTEEFAEALAEANKQAWDLIDAYDLIKDVDWHIDEKTGKIVIDKSGEDKATQGAKEKVDALESLTNGMSLQQSAAKVDVAESDFFKGYTTTQSIDEILKTINELGEGRTPAQIKKSYEEASLEEQNQLEQKYGEFFHGDIFDSNFFDQLQNYQDTLKDYNKDMNSYFDEQLLSTLNNSKIYQDSKYKNLIYDSVTKDSQNEIDNALTELTGKTEEEIQTEFDKLLPEGYSREGNKVFDANGKEQFSNLDNEAMKKIIAYSNASGEIGENALKAATDIDNAIKGLSDSDKKGLDTLLGNLSSEDIQKYKESELTGDEFKNSILSDSAREKLKNAGIGDDVIEGWFESLQKQIENYKPPEFDLSNWRESFENQLAISEKISKEGILKDKYYDELSPELQQYFKDLQNGTYILTISADEFNQKIRELSQQDLKSSIEDSQYAIEQGRHAYGDSLQRAATTDEVTRTANTMMENSSLYSKDFDNIEKRNQAVIAMQNATGIKDEDLAQYSTAEEKIKAIAQAWLDLTNTLENKQTAFGASLNSIDELDKALTDGTINIKSYNKALDGVIANEVKANDLDYSSITNYTNYLLENSEELKHNGKSLEENTRIAKKLAVAHAKLNKGVKTISKNWSSWDKIVKKGSLSEIQDILPDINKSLGQILDISDEAFQKLPSTFAVDNWDLIKDVIDGVDGSYEKLQQKAAEGIYLKIQGEEASTEMTSLMSELSNMIEGTNLEIDPTVNNANALDALYQLLESAGMTVDDIMSLFDTLGWQPEIEWKKMTASAASATHNTGYMQVPEMAGYGQWNVQSVPLTGEDAISGDTEVWVPVIKSATKKGGSGTYTPQPPQSSGGGGGGSTKAPTHAEHKNYLDKERYHTVKNQIEDLNAAYDDLNKAKDRAFGKNRIDYIDKEIAKTDELIKKQDEYLSEIKSNLPTDQALMESWYEDAIGGPAIEYDASGNISNFDEIQDAMFNKYNSMADSLTEDDDDWKIFEKKYEQFEKALEQYEETYDLLRDETQKKQDLINQQIDAKLEKVQYSIEVQLDVPDSAIKVLEYKIGKLDDSAFDAVSTIGLLSKQMDEVNKKIKINRQGLEEVLKLTKGQIIISDVLKGDMSSLYEKGKLVVSLTNDQVEAIKEYRDNLLDLNSELDDLRSNIEDKVMDTFSAWTDKLSKGTSSVEHYGNVLASYKNIIDTIGKDTLGITNSFLDNLAQATVTNAIDQLKSTKNAYDSVLKAKGEAEKALEEAKANGDKESQKFWEDTLLEINEQVQSSNEEMMSSWENALSTITNQFENTLNNLIDSFNNSVYQMGGGLNSLADDFSRQQDIADTMLDDYQKIYELSKLSRDINKTIDDTDIISGKQKLKKLLGQINNLQEDGNEMSKYDLEYLQKTYDLRLAEIELEEAQRAKNTVRLQKDSEGNWSYIYTQSSDAIDSAQQKYEDALYAMQDLSSNYIDEMSQKLIDTSQEMAEAIANVRVEDFASQEDYYVAIKKIQDSYEDQLRMQENELNKAIKNNKELYDEDWTNYHNATGYKISDTENFVTSFKDSLLGGLLNSQENSANFSEVIKASADALTDSLKTAAKSYFEAIEAAMNAAGTSTKNFANDATESINKVVSESKDAVEEMNKITSDMDSNFKSLIDSVTGWQKEYSIQLGLMEKANLSLIESFNKLLECLSIDPETGSINYDISKAIENKNANNDSNSSSNSSSSSSAMAKYDTGGYTGNWGDAGKLAVLHEKELVLNSEDTTNVLTAVQLVRAMLSTIDLNAQQASTGFGQLVASTIRDNSNETFQQDVHIVAEFPNVEDHNEIKEAFNNLINQAAQYANRV